MINALCYKNFYGKIKCYPISLMLRGCKAENTERKKLFGTSGDRSEISIPYFLNYLFFK